MLDLKQIASFYPESVQPFKKNILREYLQYKILEIIFDTKHAEKLAFMGGTAIRIIYGNKRFSEDIDFNNFGLTEKIFEEITEIIKTKLIQEGYSIEIKNIFKHAFRCSISFHNILYESGISNHREEKLMIRFDTESQGIDFQPDKIIINKFDVFTRINVIPEDLLLAQKIFAILNRERMMGRDLYDAIFLFGRTKPDFDYLTEKANISNMVELQKILLTKCKALDFSGLSRDVEPFLVNPGDAKKILLFRDYIENIHADS